MIEYVSLEEKDEDQCLRESQKIVDKKIQEVLGMMGQLTLTMYFIGAC